MNTLNIINLQKFSVHDGEGIRTTVFFKGCPLKCAWCHNPESHRFDKELMFYKERCTGCAECVKSCPNNAISLQSGKAFTDYNICNATGNCVSSCIYNAREIIGKILPVSKIVELLLRERIFYETSCGGVTLSGGEVMAQDIKCVFDLVKRLHKEDISVNIDTCGEAPYENFKTILPYVDTFLYDFKAYTTSLHQQYTGCTNQRILNNLIKLSEDGARIYLRVPIVGVNSTDEETKKMIRFLKENHIKISEINLLPYHKVGSDKFERVGLVADIFHPPTPERMQQLKEMWETANLAPVYIGG